MMITGILQTSLYVAYGLVALNAVANLAYLWWVGRQRPDPPRWPTVSVLIPARNEALNLRRLLPTLSRQDYPDFEIVLYDDASSDETADVARALGGERLTLLRGEGPPAGWIGKPNACHQAARAARGDVFLFLDADTALLRPDALRRLVGRYLALPAPSVLTGIPSFSGGGLVLVSMLTYAVVLLTPLALATRVRWRSLGALNGQCWLMNATLYRRLEPHAKFRSEIVEDIMIGRWLLGQGIVPWATLMSSDLQVRMYGSLREAWHGFRKNFYRVSGGGLVAFWISWAIVALLFLALPAVMPPVAIGLFVAKLVADRLGRFPWWLWLLAPVTLILALGSYADSAVAHWRGRVMWKDRDVLSPSRNVENRSDST